MPGRPRRFTAIGAVVAMLLAGLAQASPVTDKEVAVRAAFLFRLAFFVSWPADTFAAADSPLRICLREPRPAPLARILTEQTRSRTVQDRPVQVVGLDADQPADGCHVLYLEADSARPGAPLYSLVVVDSLGGLDRAGVLALVREQTAGETRLVFYADRTRLQHAPFTVSAQLLRLVRFRESGAG